MPWQCHGDNNGPRPSSLEHAVSALAGAYYHISLFTPGRPYTSSHHTRRVRVHLRPRTTHTKVLPTSTHPGTRTKDLVVSSPYQLLLPVTHARHARCQRLCGPRPLRPSRAWAGNCMAPPMSTFFSHRQGPRLHALCSMLIDYSLCMPDCICTLEAVPVQM